MSDDPFKLLPSAAVRQIELAKDAHLFRQGAPANGLFRVSNGRLVMSRITEAGDQVTLFVANSGDVFAEASIFSATYHCDAICMENAAVERFAKKAVLEALKTDVDFAISFTRLLAVQVQKTRQLVELLSIKSAEERVFSALQLGFLDGSVIDFASKVGLTHEACYRALRRLVQAGKINKQGRGRYSLL